MSDVTHQSFPFNRLRLSSANVRKNRGSASYKAGVKALAASIMAMHKLTGKGLLQNLVVHVVGDVGEVVAGGRRYDALAVLVESGELPIDYPVQCLAVQVDALTAASLTENALRDAMHPAEEFDAFQGLVSEGWTVDRIADSFGVTPLVVERRLKLRAAAPALIEAFRNNELSTDQLIALCSTDNHELQVAVWNRVKNSRWNNSPSDLRRAVIGTEIEAANDPRVAFIGGVTAYENAGGKVRRDLFADDGIGVILEDSALLETLVQARLESIAADLSTEGWGWTEVWPQMDWTALDRLGRAPTVVVSLSETDADHLAHFEDELEKVRSSMQVLAANQEDLTEAERQALGQLQDQRDALELRIEALNEKTVVCDPVAVEHAGAVVIYQRGEARIERGLIRTADREKLAALLQADQRITGGRVSEPAGRKADDVSDALRRSLLGYRNLAAQTMTTTNVQAAKILFVCKFVAELRTQHSMAPTDLSVTNGYGTRTSCVISDSAGQAMVEAFVESGMTLISKLPKNPEQLWDALASMKTAELDKLMAYAIARSVSLTEAAEGISGKYLTALGVNMSAHFVPTAENYFGRVSKNLIIEALTEAGKIAGDDDLTALMAMKKGALATEAENRMSGSGWVPKLIRSADQPAKRNARVRAVKAA